MLEADNDSDSDGQNMLIDLRAGTGTDRTPDKLGGIADMKNILGYLN